MAHQNDPIAPIGGPQLNNVQDRYEAYNTSATETRTVTTNNNPLKLGKVIEAYHATAARHAGTIDLTNPDAFKGTINLGLWNICYNPDSPFSPNAVGDLKGAYDEFGQLIPKGQNLNLYS